MMAPTKLFGTYPQKQKDLYMQRIPVFAGQITPPQLYTLAALAIEFTNATPLHLTTRQDIELHHVPQDDLKTALERIHDVGFLTYGAGGDNVRNITVCPCCEFDPVAFDVLPLADDLRKVLHENPVRQDMPRKFKISFAGCTQPQTRPFVNDLSFIATSPTTVRVIGAGSLGPKPETGIVLYETFSVNDISALTLAAIKLFKDYGDRENRRRARLRHVRQRQGDSEFLRLLNDYFLSEKETSPQSDIKLTKGQSGWSKSATIQTIAGELNPQDAMALAEAAASANAHIRINFHHGLDIYAKEGFIIPDQLKPLTNLPRIVACPGSTTCTNGLADCPNLAATLSETLIDNANLKDELIAISGCPNNCAHSAIANIGLVGRIKTIDGEKQEVYQILLGGDNGVTAKLAEPDQIVPANELSSFLSKL
jgi:sulfite reductase beta subunit-like hemoprotein